MICVLKTMLLLHHVAILAMIYMSQFLVLTSLCPVFIIVTPWIASPDFPNLCHYEASFGSLCHAMPRYAANHCMFMLMLMRRKIFQGVKSGKQSCYYSSIYIRSETWSIADTRTILRFQIQLLLIWESRHNYCSL